MTTSLRSTTVRALAAASLAAVPLALLFASAGCGSTGSAFNAGIPGGTATQAQVVRGRYLVVSVGCADCHNRGKDDPTDPNWLAGFIGAAGAGGQGAFDIGPYKTYAANLTPNSTNGIGKFTNRQIFNALRYGLDPADSPDAIITSMTPGQGNFPSVPHYLAPPMPWPAFRHMPDEDLWAIVSYVKHGIKANANIAPKSQGPPDFWASSYTPGKIGPYPMPAFPIGSEQFTP